MVNEYLDPNSSDVFIWNLTLLSEHLRSWEGNGNFAALLIFTPGKKLD